MPPTLLPAHIVHTYRSTWPTYPKSYLPVHIHTRLLRHSQTPFPSRPAPKCHMPTQTSPRESCARNVRTGTYRSSTDCPVSSFRKPAYTGGGGGVRSTGFSPVCYPPKYGVLTRETLSSFSLLFLVHHAHEQSVSHVVTAAFDCIKLFIFKSPCQTTS